MNWFVIAIVVAYLVVAVVITKRYFLRRHSVIITQGDRGAAAAMFVGLAWPLTIWSSSVRNPELCQHRHHVQQRSEILRQLNM